MRANRAGEHEMIRDLKPYPAYKDSGVPWLGKVPEHWLIERLKSVMSNVIQMTGELQNGESYVALEHVESWTGRLRQADPEVSFDSQVKRFQSGDVLFGKLRPYLAKVTRPTNDGRCVGEFFVLRPRVSNVTAPYVEQLLRSKPVIDLINSSTFGAKMPRANWEFVGGIVMPLPPLPEQAAIVRFLDFADRRIRRSIRAKQKLIKLLEEQKQAIINQAVTRGLDPDVPMKDSGVEWLGDVPEHWEVVALRRVTKSRCDGPFGSGLKSTHYVDFGVRVIRLQNIGHGQFKNADAAYISEEHYAKLGDHSVITGDLLIAGLGDEKIPPGRACIAPEGIEPAMVKADCFRFRLDPRRVQTSFAALQLASTALAAASVLSSGATRQRINLQSMSARSIILPPLPEQSAIVCLLNQITTNIDHAIASTQREITFLKEYRTRLIADVVTGQLDVREVAANLPDEVRESEPLDDVDALTEDELSAEDVDLDVEDGETETSGGRNT